MKNRNDYDTYCFLSDYITDTSFNKTEWRRLKHYKNISFLDSSKYTEFTTKPYKDRCKNTLKYFIGHLDCLEILLRLRSSGVNTPVALIPDINCVREDDIYKIYLLSRLRIHGDIIFAGSSAPAKSYSYFGFQTQSFYPLGIDRDFFSIHTESNPNHAAQHNLSQKSKKLLYTGRLEKDKSVAELIDAFKVIGSTQDVYLLLAYHIWDKKYLKHCISRAKNDPRIIFYCQPDRRTLRSLYMISDLFVTMSTSEYETFGRSVVEAMACGAVPVAPDYNGFSETIGKAAGLRVDVSNTGFGKKCQPECFVNSVVDLLNNEYRLSLLRENALNRSAMFSNSFTIGRFATLLKGLEIGKKPNKNSIFRSESIVYPDEINNMTKHLHSVPVKQLINNYCLTQKHKLDLSNNHLDKYLDLWFDHF